MQKKFIALAVAGLVSGAAFAQSNVTIYGVADVSFEGVNANGTTNNSNITNVPANGGAVSLANRTRVESNSSYIGFKGTEALGNGLSAIFQLESQVAFDGATNTTGGATQQNAFATRDTYVGLTSAKMGTVMLGYISTPYRSMGAKFDVMPGATGAAGFNGLVGHMNLGVSKNANGTTDNNFGSNINTVSRTQAIAYQTPTFSGFNGILAYTSNENKSADVANSSLTSAGGTKLSPSAWNIAANYDNGPMSFGYSYLFLTDLQTAAIGGFGAGTSSTLNSQLLAGRYVFGGATTVSAMYNWNNLNVNGVTANGGNGAKNGVFYLGLKHVMGAHEFAGMYALASNGSVSNNGTGTQNSDDRGAQQFGLRYGYNFSKRTQAYALWTKIDNKSNGNYDFGNGNAANNSQTGALATNLGAGSDPQVFGVGVRHNF